MTIEEAITIYLESRAKKLTVATINRYQSVLKRFCAWIGKSNKLKSIKDRQIDQYQLLLQDELGKTTQRYHADILRGFFKFWTIRGETKIIYEAIEGPKREEHHPNFITQEKFERIDAELPGDHYEALKRKLIFNLLWDTGMRIGELLSLNLSDISSTENCATILTEKSKKLRIVVWSKRTHTMLLKYLGTRICQNQRPELFQTPVGRRYDGRRVRLTARSVQRWCKQLEVKLGFPVNPHAFRHGKMHRIINAGGTRAHVQSVAGHSSITSSEVYVRLNKQEQMKMQSRFLDDDERPEKSGVVFPMIPTGDLQARRKVI